MRLTLNKFPTVSSGAGLKEALIYKNCQWFIEHQIGLVRKVNTMCLPARDDVRETYEGVCGLEIEFLAQELNDCLESVECCDAEVVVLCE